MTFDLIRRKQFIQGIRAVGKNCLDAKTQAEKESWLGDAVRIMVKYQREDYPDILDLKTSPSELVNLSGSVDLFITAMRNSYYPRAYVHLQGVERILNLTDPALNEEQAKIIPLPVVD